MEFYAAFLSVAPGGFDAEIVMKGKSYVRHVIDTTAKKPAGELTQKDKELINTLQLVEEAMARGIRFLPPHLYKSDYKYFLPEDGRIRMPFTALSGLGETAAQKIVEARDAGEIYSVEDLRTRAGVSKAVIETLRAAKALEGLAETDQFSFFS
jgi:DNA polymerase-3 subunit alpha (Gram-positive type)